MKIWLLTSELVFDIAGGIARYIDNFARLLGQAGHEVLIIGVSPTPRDERLAPGVRVITITPPTDPANQPFPYDTLSYIPAVSYHMAEKVLALAAEGGPPDLIEAQESNALPYYLLQRKLTESTPLDNTPILIMLHGPIFELLAANQKPCYPFPDYWIGQMEKFCLLAADACVSPSRFLAERMQTALDQSIAITVIPLPGVVTTESTGEAVQPGEVVCVGRLEVCKGVLPLVEACHRLWQQGATFRLTLIGGDTAYPRQNTTVGTYLQTTYAPWIDSGHLTLTGQLPYTETLARMRRAWTMVIPSLWENFPNVCIEAMTPGQLMLVSRHGGQADMVGEAGFIFDWHTPGDFERQLYQALALTPDERHTLTQAAQTRITELCHPDTVLTQRLEHYQTIIQNQQPRRHFPTLTPSVAIPPNTGQPDLLSVIGTMPQTTYHPTETARDLESARGEFVAFIKSGVTVTPDFFARAICVLRCYPNVGFVYSWVEMPAGIWPTWNTEFPYLLAQSMLRGAVVVRRAACTKTGASMPTHADWIRLVAAGYAGVSLPAPLTEQLEPNRPVSDIQGLQHYRDLTQHHPDLYRHWGVELFRLQQANGPSHTWSHPGQSVLDSASPNTVALMQTLSSQDISRWMPLSKLLEIVAFKLAHQPGFGWLHRFRERAKAWLRRP